MKHRLIIYLIMPVLVCTVITNEAIAQSGRPVMQYTVSMPLPSSHYFHVELHAQGWNMDTVNFKMPQWMPGYYQIMNYSEALENFSAKDSKGKELRVDKLNKNSWQIIAGKNKAFNLAYDIKTTRKFVATSYLDSSHGYIVPVGIFLYVDGHINTPVSVKVIAGKEWNKIATGLEPVAGKQNEFTAPDFDILYDCPILVGNLEEFPSFYISGIEHRFIAYNPGKFDRAKFIDNLKKVVEASIAVIGDIPYKQYTFIGIGPGRGGIEHLNNTTVSFDGKGLDTKAGMNRILNFLAHEYFHHYNVKRIRPFELGPFDYDKGSKTNLLWVSEGLSVYYEYMMVKRAGLADEQTLFSNFEGNINAHENNPGRFHQSLVQASYKTWKDGPFGNQGADAQRSISYYDKGPVAGLLLDLQIRHSTQNKRSLDDVMQLLYRQYYKKENRGFTDAEFQHACEKISDTSLNDFFEYVYTTKELDYNKYLFYAGLKLDVQEAAEKDKRKFRIIRIETPDALQSAILRSWLGE